MTPKYGKDGRRIVKRPIVGELVECKFGRAEITMIGYRAESLWVRTEAHGEERIERAEDGWWTVCQAPADPNDEQSGWYETSRYGLQRGWTWRLRGEYGAIGGATAVQCEACGRHVAEGECAVRPWTDGDPRDRNARYLADGYHVAEPNMAHALGARDGWRHLRCAPEALESWAITNLLPDAAGRKALGLDRKDDMTLSRAVQSEAFTWDICEATMVEPLAAWDRGERRLCDIAAACQTREPMDRARSLKPLFVDGGAELVRQRLRRLSVVAA